MLGLLAATIFTISVGGAVIARHSLNEELFKIFSSKPKVDNEKIAMMVVYASTLIGYIVVLLHGISREVSGWSIFSMLPAMLLLALLVKNILKNDAIANTSFFKNKVVNFILVNSSMHFIYLFTILNLGVIFWTQ